MKKDITMKELPLRLGVGKGIQGPDYFGCCNTGLAPVILNSKHLDKYRPGGYRFAVGPALYIGDACYYRVLGKTTHKSKHVKEGRVVRFFKTYKGAKKYFNELYAKIVTENRAERDRYNGLKAKAAKGDMQAALDLGDY